MSSARANRPRLTGFQRVLEAAIIVSTLLSLFLLLALCSFSPADPGWTQTAYQGPVANWMGSAGAWLADVLLFVFGFTAYLMPFLMAILGWLLFKAHHRLRDIDYFTMGLRFIGFFLTLFGFSAIASINFDDIYTFSAGGIIGDAIRDAMMPYFNLHGTILLLVCFFCAGFTLLTGIAWMTIVEQTGYYTLTGCRAIRDAVTGLGNRDEKPSAGEQETYEEEYVEAEPVIGDTAGQGDEPPAAPRIYRADPPPLSLPDDELTDLSFSAREDDEPEERATPDLSLMIDPPEEQAVPTMPELDDLPWQETPVAAAPAPAPAPQPAARVVMPPVMPEAEDEEPLTPLPSISLLDRPDKKANPISEEDLERVSRLVEVKLLDFNVQCQVVAVYPGPVITRFELDLAPGVKVSKISGLAKDLARSLSAMSVRVVEVIPGKSVIGLELPNEHREIVYFSEGLSSDKFAQSQSPLTMVLGKDIAGEPVVVDLGKMPHLLVAGTTGSGKSVGVNAMILSLLYKATPKEVRMIMIDPKMLELSVYEGIPHLLSEVVTDMKEAANALRWCVGEMERRYKLMSALGVRNLKGYNAKITEAEAAGQPLHDPLWQPGDSMDQMPPLLETLPSIVVVVDEFADMMMIVGKKVEELIARIAQKARAAGIHLILATQRPSVDVITGLIKANIPTRIAFQVSSRVDSRTILDQQGAEQLLGQGDMLYMPPGTSVPTRVHGAFVDDHEVHKVVADWKKRGKPNYIEEILSGDSSEAVLLPGEQAESDDESDPLYDEAVAFVTESRRGSISSVQRKFKIGYNRAARLIEQMEHSGVVSAPGHNGSRDVLAPPPPKV